jgi:hypothetical protein
VLNDFEHYGAGAVAVCAANPAWRRNQIEKQMTVLRYSLRQADAAVAQERA